MQFATEPVVVGGKVHEAPEVGLRNGAAGGQAIEGLRTGHDGEAVALLGERPEATEPDEGDITSIFDP